MSHERKGCLPQKRLDWVEVDTTSCLTDGPKIEKIAIHKNRIFGRDSQGQIFRPIEILSPKTPIGPATLMNQKKAEDQMLAITKIGFIPFNKIVGGRSYEVVSGSNGRIVFRHEVLQTWQATGIKLPTDTA